MSIRPEDWPRVREAFEAALAVPATDERRAYVTAFCGGDGALLSAVEQLLASHNRASQFLETPLGATITEIGEMPRTTTSEGRRIGPYQIAAPIGAGGMGEVYRARDSKLGRDVAIKILPTVFRNDPERLVRFEREARMLAALNHPNIASIYGLEESDGEQALVLELVDGPTLAELVASGPMPIAEALDIARQIAEALEAAHEKGIIHRDLKPANIKVAPNGIVKVLDFGLAKAWEGPLGGHATAAPTATEAGDRRILGTPAYMSPEQARGRPLDKRTDIWSFGCVLFEMLTGRAAFAGESVSDTFVHILERDPDWEALPSSTPARVRDLLRRCLQKDAGRRVRDIGDGRLELDQALAVAPGPAGLMDAAGSVSRQRRTDAARLRRVLWVSASALIAAVATGVATWTLSPRVRVGESGVARLTVALGADEQIGELTGGAIALSPDGSRLAYVGSQGAGPPVLYVRRIDSLVAGPLPGTESAMSPFFSPDGDWLGFFAQGNLKKVPVAGGIPQTLSNGPAGKGGSWGPDGTIYFAPANSSGLWKVSALGGVAQEVTKVDRNKGEVSHRWPQVLPGGQDLLFTVWTGPGLDEKRLESLRLATGERTVLLLGASTGRYVPSGHIVYSRGEALMAVPFELSRLAVTGTPIALEEYVRERNEGALYAFSESGSLAYVPGSPQWDSERRLVWVDDAGNVEPLPAPLRPYRIPRISPDGRYAAVDIRGDTFRIWIYDFLRATLTPLTSGASSQIPVWTPDGTQIVYRGTRRGFRNLFWRPADGSGEEEQLARSENFQIPVSFSPNGWLAFHEVDPSTGYDIWVLPVDGDRKPQVFLRTPFNEGVPRLSPDGRWLAYMSDESGRREIYVQPFPGPGRKWLISTEGGNEPVWSPDGRRLFYVSGNRTMAVDVATQPTFTAGSPRLLYEGRFQSGWELASASGYDVSPDGRRFLRVQTMRPEEAPRQIHVVINWFQELNRRVSANQ